MDPLLPVMSFLSLGLTAVLLVLYFAVPKESPAMVIANADRNYESRYLVGPEIFQGKSIKSMVDERDCTT